MLHAVMFHVLVHSGTFEVVILCLLIINEEPLLMQAW